MKRHSKPTQKAEKKKAQNPVLAMSEEQLKEYIE
jgi:hypothetical protein